MCLVRKDPIVVGAENGEKVSLLSAMVTVKGIVIGNLFTNRNDRPKYGGGVRLPWLNE
jgi:hypothetical protein